MEGILVEEEGNEFQGDSIAKSQYFESLLMTLLILSVLSWWVFVMIKLWSRQRPILGPTPCPLLIILGSGGHTTEMLKLVKNLNKDQFSPRTYVIAHSDRFSKEKAIMMEENRKAPANSYKFKTVYRVREVGQSWVSTIMCSLPICIIQSFQGFMYNKPYLILSNGPGICVPFCIIAKFMRCLGVWQGMSVYIESVCRVKSLSLSGRLLRHIVDTFIVQWPELLELYDGPNIVYMGRIT